MNAIEKPVTAFALLAKHQERTRPKKITASAVHER